MRYTPVLSTAAGVALVIGSTLALSNYALAQQPSQSADELHACQVTSDLIAAWITDMAVNQPGAEKKIASFMTDEYKARRQQQFATRRQQFAGNAGRQNDIRITGAVVLSCTAHASGGDITVRQERRDQTAHTSTGEITYVLYGANFRVSPKSWLVEDWQEIAE
jgi:hypothetical protein